MKYEYNKTITKTIFPSDIYGPPVKAKVEEQYIIKGFRPPLEGELYVMQSNYYALIEKALSAFSSKDPRYIVEKKPALRKWLLEETGEFRAPQDGEHYVGLDGKPWVALHNYNNNYDLTHRRIVKVTEVKQ